MHDLDLGSPHQGSLAFCPHHTLSHPSFLSEPGPLLKSSKQGDLLGQRGFLDMTTTFSASQLQPGLSCLLSDCSFKDLSTSRLAITSQKPLAFHSLQGKAQTPVLGISAIPASPALGPSPRAGTRDSQPLGPLALTAHPHTRLWEQVSRVLVLANEMSPERRRAFFPWSSIKLVAEWALQNGPPALHGGLSDTIPYSQDSLFMGALQNSSPAHGKQF